MKPSEPSNKSKTLGIGIAIFIIAMIAVATPMGSSVDGLISGAIGLFVILNSISRFKKIQKGDTTHSSPTPSLNPSRKTTLEPKSKNTDRGLSEKRQAEQHPSIGSKGVYVHPSHVDTVVKKRPLVGPELQSSRELAKMCPYCGAKRSRLHKNCPSCGLPLV